MNRFDLFRETLKKEILMLDGAMGTEIQKYKLEQKDFHGERFKDHPVNLRGNNDILTLTRPDIIKELNRKYLEAGSDIIETNTFSANSISQADYDLEDLVAELNLEGARLAKSVTDAFEKETGRTCFVVGGMGPTTRTASMSPDVEDPAARNVSFDELADTYYVAVENLIAGGVDAIIIETITDALNAKAAVYAVQEYNEKYNVDIPIMISGTITDASGRTLTGQTSDGFYTSLMHANPVSFGLNCSLGADDLLPHIESLGDVVNCAVSVYPNAGLPDELGNYNDSPEYMGKLLGDLAKRGKLNIVGGCCGTTPAHIKAMAEAVKPYPPRPLNEPNKNMQLSGLERTEVTPESLFVNIGERANVAGSRKFARLIREKNYEEALSVAQEQVENGAQIVDVNLDDGMLDAFTEMVTVLNYFGSDPAVSRVPFMIDSSKWEVIEAGLKVVQGKAVVNSISLKEGEEKFIEQAKKIKRYGAATVVMAFDETGQADTKDRKVEICQRSYDILVNEVGFNPQDIIFDPNIFAVGTGLEEHRRYAIDFFEATREIKERMPEVHISGGVSNVSFSFRGNNPVREAMHSCFLYHAIKEGMDMGIVNPSMLQIYEDIDPALRDAIEDLLLDRRDDATERLLDIAQNVTADDSKESKMAAWRELPVRDRITHALTKGVTDYLDNDLQELLDDGMSPVDCIEDALMAGMNHVGELFGSGQMFLPQVVKSARVMKKGVAYLQPLIEAAKEGNAKSAGKVLMATVKGDVHDIGKNIVSIVLQCNNFEVIDIGVMVPLETILDTAQKEDVDIIGLSGLITPSLDEMVHVAEGMKKRGMTIPLMVGGATTSRIHTAIKMAPVYEHGVVQVKDASLAPGVVKNLLGDKKEAYLKEINASYDALRESREEKAVVAEKATLADARANAFVPNFASYTPTKPSFLGVRQFVDYPIEELISYVDWLFFFRGWDMQGKLEDIMVSDEGKKLYADAQVMMKRIVDEKLLEAAGAVGFFPAHSIGDDIEIYDEDKEEKLGTFYTMRQQRIKKEGPNWALADLIASKESGVEDYIGMFAVTAGLGLEESLATFDDDDEYSSIMLKLCADRLAEAFGEKLHEMVRKELWGYAPDEACSAQEILDGKYRGIRPAPGYPACPDHRDKGMIVDLLNMEELGMTLTESFMMVPTAAVSGYYFSHPESSYFGVGKVTMEQVEDLAARRGESVETNVKWLESTIL